MSDSLQPHELQHARPPCPSPTPGVHSNSHTSSRWCHPVISSSVVPFSSCPQSLPASESFPVSQLFTWGGQSTGVSALAYSVQYSDSRCLKVTPFTATIKYWSLSFNISPSNEHPGLISFKTDWFYLHARRLSSVFSNTTVQKHQFFCAQLSL